MNNFNLRKLGDEIAEQNNIYRDANYYLDKYYDDYDDYDDYDEEWIDGYFDCDIDEEDISY